MSEPIYPVDSLVVYKKQPARLLKSGERLEIEIEGGNIVKVRPKTSRRCIPARCAA